MWINITKEIFDNSDFKGLNYLYQILSYNPTTSSKPRYNIVVDTEKIKESENFKKLASIEKSLLEFLDLEYAYYKTNSQNISYKISSKSNNLHFNIEEAVLFFTQPVSIILENNKNDSEFFLAIIKHFGNNNTYNKAQEHIDNAWLKFENAGGCGNIPNFLQGFLNQFKLIALKNNRNLFDYFRGIIIIDSDKEFQNQPIKGSHTNLLKKLKLLGFDTKDIINEESGEIINNNNSFHILEKRMMENYLPIEVFQEINRQIKNQDNQDLKDWLSVYLSLNRKEQIDFINIPDGFPPNENKFDNGKRKNVSSDLLKLYNLNITDINFEKLDKGFNFKGFNDKGILNTGNEFNVKNELPKWFKKGIITKRNLAQRDGKGELYQILEKIKILL